MAGQVSCRSQTLPILVFVTDMTTPRIQFLATNGGFWIALTLLCAVSVLSAAEFRRYATSIVDVRDVIQQHQAVRSHAALGEISRLSWLIGEAARAENGGETGLLDVQVALEVLRARADRMGDQFETLYVGEKIAGSRDAEGLISQGRAAIAAIGNLVTLADEVYMGTAGPHRSGSAELRVDHLSTAMIAAQREMFAYVDLTKRMEAKLLNLQSEKVLYLTRATLTFLALVTAAGAASLHLIRREIVARKLRENAERRADRLAYFDSLTGLANRVQFQDKVDAFLSPSAKGGLVLIDLDGFKDINDRHGHAMGDAVLRQIARLIGTEAEKNGGTAARLGGDEFAVFLGTDNTTFLMGFGRRLVEACALPVESGGTRVHPGVSIGIATTTQVSATRRLSYDYMMRVADFALYASKAAGRGRFTLYDADLETVMAERRALIKELPRAIHNNELEVYLQPKVLLDTGAVTGFEALVRWRRNGKILNPAQFIDIAEDSDRIRDIDAYVLDRAVEVVSNWNQRYRTNYGVSVNLSGEHFRARSPMPFVADALKRHHFAAELLTLEITETVQLANWDIVEANVSELKELGCRISIDDFGTGYSSLVYLRTIPADELKIDKSLIDEIEDSAQAQFIVDAVIDLAASLNLEVVVEGIERPEQKKLVTRLGCKSGQGYLFGRPKPASDALADATYPHPELRRVGL